VSRAINALPYVEATDLVAICQASPEAARRYVEREQLFLPVMPDPHGLAMRALQVSGIPFAVLLDCEGRVESKGVPASYRDLLALIGSATDAEPAWRELRIAGAGAAG